jgi:predicted component of type VI protein secretion system
MSRYPQKWRLEALCEDGELDGEICETVPLKGSGAMIGAQRSSAAQAPPELGHDEQLIELEHRGGVEAARYFGDVRPQHCRLLHVDQNFYAWATESEIGTIVDGQKCRQTDGPVPIRDGSVVLVGKYLILCEIGTDRALQDRRSRLLAGERAWTKAETSIADKQPDVTDADLDILASTAKPEATALQAFAEANSTKKQTAIINANVKISANARKPEATTQQSSIAAAETHAQEKDVAQEPQSTPTAQLPQPFKMTAHTQDSLENVPHVVHSNFRSQHLGKQTKRKRGGGNKAAKKARQDATNFPDPQADESGSDNDPEREAQLEMEREAMRALGLPVNF